MTSRERYMNGIRGPRILLGFLALFLVGHLVFLTGPFVNGEWWYADTAWLIATEGLRSGVTKAATIYANPVGFPVSIIPFHWLLGVSEFSARLPSLIAGMLTVGIIYIWVSRIFGSWEAVLAAVIVGTSPLFWLESGRAYTDVLFVSLLTLAFVLLDWGLRSRRESAVYSSALVFALSGLVKYSAAVFLPVANGWIFLRAVAREGSSARSSFPLWRQMIVFNSLLLTVGSSYLLWVHQALGHVLPPEMAQAVGFTGTTPLGSLQRFPPRFFAIVMWIGIFAGPLGLFALSYLVSRPRPAGVAAVLLGLLSSLLGISLVQRALLPEMGLGWVEFLLSRSALYSVKAVLIFLGSVVIIGILLWIREHWEKHLPIGLWLLFGVAAYAFFKPTMRYLLSVLPPLTIFLASVIMQQFKDAQWRHVKFGILGTAFCLHMGVSLFNSMYFAAQGSAAARVAQFVNQHGLRGIPFSYFGPVTAHSGYLIRKDLFIHRAREQARYDLVMLRQGENPQGLIYEAPVRLLGITFKRYAVLQERAATLEGK